MKALGSKVAYLNELAVATQFLPNQYFKELQDMLPTKTLARLKNARAGIVQDADVLKALKRISEKERKRRQATAKQELKATQAAA